MRLDAGSTGETDEAVALVARGDTAAAARLMRLAVQRHVLDPGAHAFLGGLLVNDRGTELPAALEAYAAVQLAPDVARNWWLLGFVQMKAMRYDEAQQSIERFLAMGGGVPGEVAQARQMLDWLHSRAPGGERFQQALRE